MILCGRSIYNGKAEGYVLKCPRPIVVLGDVDEKRGYVENCGYIKDKILVFPRGAGSTVGSYTIYGLRYYGTAPKAIILEEAEPIVAVGVIMAEIPTVDMINISDIKNGSHVKVDGNIVEIKD